jgi:hypothetical protein
MGQASPRWALLQPFDIYAKDGSGDVYLHRLRIVRTPWFAVYLHDLNLPDADRDPHDHPWAFGSLVLRGGYTERLFPYPHVEGPVGPRVQRWKRWSWHRMPTDQAHMIDAVEPRTKTLILAGRRRRTWGFFTPDGWVPWTEYVEVGDHR